jgi:site-specific recombinase XerD
VSCKPAVIDYILKMAKVKKSRGGLAPDKYLSREQIQQLREYLSQAKARGGRRAAINEMIIDVMLNSGLRAGELCALQMQDLPLCHGKPCIFVQRGKGAISRTIDINSALSERIKVFVKRYRPNAKPKSCLFLNENQKPFAYRSLYSKVRIIGQSAGLENLRPHMLRHSYATWLYRQCKDLLMLQDSLGHSDPATTAVYAKTLPEERRKIVEDFEL